VSFHYKGRIEDQFLGLQVGTVMRPGADGNCGTTDDVLVPKGTGGGQVSENTFAYLNGTFDVTFMAFNGVPVGGTATTAPYCFLVLASDQAADETGADAFNSATSFARTDFTWQPLAPTTGSIAGTVTVGTAPLAGITVSRGTSAPTTTTGADGKYQFEQVPPGTYVVSMSNIPAGITCSPTTKTASVTAGNQTTVDFSCTAAPTTGSIAGHVMAGSTPIPGVTVSRGSGGPPTTTASDGSYRFDGRSATFPPASRAVPLRRRAR
jgi:hypothetical protein